MTIIFSKEFNRNLRNEVRNFNKRRDRLEKAGYRNLPEHQTVSELKARYKVPSDLTNELQRLKNFNRGDIERKVETQGGVKSVAWEYEYLKGNQKEAKAYFEREYERVSKRVGKFPGERQYLDTIAAKINLLEQNIDYLGQREFKAMRRAVDQFTTYPTKLKTNYRAFLSEVDIVMDRVGIKKEKRDAFFKKFEKLTPTQFLYAYDNNDIIGRIYDLADSPEYGKFKLNTTDEEAEELIDTLMEEADDIVKDAQLNMD